MNVIPSKIINHIRDRKISKFKWKDKEHPFLLIIAYADWASLGLRLSKAINKYTNWNSECVSHHSNVIHNPLTENEAKNNQQKYNHIRKIMRYADVIIFFAGMVHYRPCDSYINKNAYIGVWHVGTDYRKRYDLFINEVHPYIDLICVGKGFRNTEKNVIVLPALLDVDSYKVQKRKSKKIIIGHSPTSRLKKHTDILIDAMKDLKKKFGNNIDFDIIENVSNNECLKRKRRCHIFFDQIVNTELSYSQLPREIPMYGVSLLEAAAFGLVCMSHANFPDTPLICVKNKEDIVKIVSYLFNNRDKMKEISKKTREWVVKEHSYENVAKRFIFDVEKRIKEINNGC